MTHRKAFALSELVVVSRAKAHDKPLCLGDRVKLNSGSPLMLVVDASDDVVTTAWRDESGSSHEDSFPAICLSRLS
jgi:uncharacterized protein YodC (DUF2158 family)